MNGGRVAWLNPDDPPDAFPPLENATREPDGLLAAGGDLSVQRVLYAYRNGIFPWYDEGQPILWWSPDPRCVMQPRDLHVSRRLRRELMKSVLQLTFNQSFAEVIRACAEPRPSQMGTWITPDMLAAFDNLHAQGWAHSIEVRNDGALVGGLYGLAIGRVFFGESMFSRQSNASKAAMLGLCNVARSKVFQLIDCQVVSKHLISMGAAPISRQDFKHLLTKLCDPASSFSGWPKKPVEVRDLLAE